MPDYIEPQEAVGIGGLRLVLSAGVPGPWGEAAKSIFHVKGIAYTPVIQRAGEANEYLKRWTGRDNAPVAVFECEPARDGWAEILALAERIAPEPRLIPDDFDDRVRMFGLAREICGEDGFGWSRRLALLAPMMAGTPDPNGPGPRMAAKYGYTADAAAAAHARVVEILERLSDCLLAQRAAGSRYFIGQSLTALDIYWACFAALYDPLPADLCPMPDWLRSVYTVSDEAVRKAAAPILLEHRDFVYREHLVLPLDF